MAASSVGLFAFYNAISGGVPWDKGLVIQPFIGTWGPWLLVPWAMLAACLAAQGRSGFPAAADAAGEDQPVALAGEGELADGDAAGVRG